MQATCQAPAASRPVARTHRRSSAVARPQVAATALAPSSADTLQGHGSVAPLPKAARKELLRAVKKAAKQHMKVQTQFATTEVVPSLIADLRRLELHTASGCDIVSGTTTSPTLRVAGTAVRIPIPLDLQAEEEPQYEPRAYQVPGRVLVCQGSKCRAKGALEVLRAVSATTSGSDQVQVLPCKCLGLCKQGPAIRVKQEGVAKCSVYPQIDASQVSAVLDSHFSGAPAPARADGSAACCTDCKLDA